MTPPSQKAIINIYGRILEALFNPKKYTPDIVAMKDLLIEGTIEIWTQVKKKLLPTPKKFHYLFTIRELSRVFGGIANVAGKPEFEVIKNCYNAKEKIKPELFLIALWRHECERVFNDKLINYTDKGLFMEYLNRITKDVFRDKLNLDDEQLLTNYFFADYQREDEYDEYGDLVAEAPLVYEACPDIDTIREKTVQKLDLHNEKNPARKMDLVIFDDALQHLLRITRVINAPSGNVLLVGVGGSGKKSLTKLAAFICKHVFFQIALTKTYNDNNLKDDIRALYTAAGPQGKQVAFIMTDAEIKKESFLEAINSMLATGEIPGLIPKEDKDIVAIECKNIWIKEEGSKGQEPPLSALWSYFLRRVKDCLHMILAFSPVGKLFRERASNFPSLFSQCNIDWFLPWPEEALVSVAHKFLTGFAMDADEETIVELEKHMGKCH
jgi:dynein heavy chain